MHAIQLKRIGDTRAISANAQHSHHVNTIAWRVNIALARFHAVHVIDLWLLCPGVEYGSVRTHGQFITQTECIYDSKCYMGHRSPKRTEIDSKKKKKNPPDPPLPRPAFPCARSSEMAAFWPQELVQTHKFEFQHNKMDALAIVSTHLGFRTRPQHGRITRVNR